MKYESLRIVASVGWGIAASLAVALVLCSLAACSTYDGPPNFGVGGVWNQDDHSAVGGHSGTSGGRSGGRGSASGRMGRA